MHDAPFLVDYGVRVGRKLGAWGLFFRPVGQGWPNRTEKQYPLPSPVTRINYRHFSKYFCGDISGLEPLSTANSQLYIFLITELYSQTSCPRLC